MRKMLLLLSALICITSLHAQQSSSRNQLTVEQTVVKFFDALSSRDSEDLKKHCAADIILYEYGNIWNLDTLILKAITLNQFTDFKRTNTFEFINTTVDQTTAWVTYRLESVIINDGKKVTKQWLETVILEKKRKYWKLKHLHSTLVKIS